MPRITYESSCCDPIKVLISVQLIVLYVFLLIHSAYVRAESLTFALLLIGTAIGELSASFKSSG